MRSLARTHGVMLAGLLCAGCVSFHQGALPGEPPAQKTQAKSADYVQLGATRVRYETYGTGRPVILIHGFASSLNVWADVGKEVAKTRQVVALDLKGFGWTDRPAGDYSPAAQARLVLELADHLGLKEFDLVGHSWGASVALKVALIAPDRVGKIALYDAWVYAEQLPTFFNWARTPFLGEAMFALWYQERPGDKMVGAFYDTSYVTEEFVESVEKQISRPGTNAAALEAVRGQTYEKWQDDYKSLPHPTLLLWGENDLVTRLEFGQKLANDLPNATLITYPRCGHFPMIEARSQSTRDLLNFLEETE